MILKNIFSYILRLPRNIGILLINIYQKCISPMSGRHCIYYPTCSEYTKQAIDKYGVMKGCILGFIRISKCNPFSNGGIDKLK